ncbi:MAG: FHA domain-containing serine/threonine-protein kinase [Chthoniobacterales bacterium]
MSAKVQLQIKQGKDAGRIFPFTEHDTFVFGRMPDCHACIPDDGQVSRHHFILEANPPQACLRDLGSLNGTWVNGKKFGSREKGETPEQGAKRRYPEVALKDGDRIQVGRTELQVSIKQPKEAPRHRVDPAVGDISLLSPDQLARLIFGSPDQGAQKPKLEIPGCKIEAEIGRGGFGAVYRARRTGDGKIVAIKVMLSRVDADDAAVEKFKREVAVTAKLQHPNIVRVQESGASGAVFYFVMEFCDGGSAWDLMFKNHGRLSLAQAKPIILCALSGLAYAHEKGVVHRDLKPQNILVSEGKARLSDFGLSKSFQQAGLSGLSMTGSFAGTPYFMPQEQITNFKYAKPASDVWSMGATIYNMLTGAYPYPFIEKRDPIDVILNEEVVPIRKRDKSIPKNLCAALDRALEKKAKNRYQTAAEMLAATNDALR